jgi:hypothetical protein
MTKKKSENETDDTESDAMESTKLYLVNGLVRAQYNPTSYNESTVWKIVRANSYDEAMEKFRKYFSDLSAAENVNYVIQSLTASEEIQ